MRIRCGNRRTKGMALVEVVMATSITALMAVALIGSFNYGFLVMKQVRENQRATQVLMEKMETIRLYSWEQVTTAGFIPSSFYDYFDPQAPQDSKGVTYYGYISIGDVPFGSTYSTNMKQIHIVLWWHSSENITRIRRATSYIAKDGIQNYVY